MQMEIYTVAFFGHRYLSNPFAIEPVLEKQIRKLLQEKQYVDFLVGRNGEFDQLVSSSVRRVKRSFRDDNSSLCLVLPYITAEYLNNQKSFEAYYDEIAVSYKAASAHPKAALRIRNREMVDRADLIICYIDHKGGGAYEASNYAKKQKSQL